MTLHALRARTKLSTAPQRLVLHAALAACMQSAVAAGTAGALPAPLDLKQDAQAAAVAGQPVLILLSMQGCKFCHVVRRNYLLPLVRGNASASQSVIREVDIESRKTFIGFDGKPISHAQFATAYGVRIVPTVLFLGPGGSQLTAPLIGGDVAGMYGAYLDNALTHASRKLSANRQRSDEEKKR